MWSMKQLIRLLGVVFQVDAECPSMRACRPSERLTRFDVRLHLDSRNVRERILQRHKATSATNWQRYAEDTLNT